MYNFKLSFPPKKKKRGGWNFLQRVDKHVAALNAQQIIVCGLLEGEFFHWYFGMH
jgi:hypothetical protein